MGRFMDFLPHDEPLPREFNLRPLFGKNSGIDGWPPDFHPPGILKPMQHGSWTCLASKGGNERLFDRKGTGKFISGPCRAATLLPQIEIAPDDPAFGKEVGTGHIIPEDAEFFGSVKAWP
ncbi:MAG: hypothetical protein GX751_06525 [Desulfuromonadaceae bacterium]|nr:hypothetical protein [Desulfuromonadaceae bacterium]